jgi:DNA invertase Pin-like site-specific DNA recombinase
MKYLVYSRKSTDTEDRQILSLDSQERELLESAKKLDLKVVKTFRESMSAKSQGRPVFNQMIKMIELGEADAILC